MIPVFQTLTVANDGQGNCFNACVASILALAPLVLLAACGQERPTLILPPASLATCADAPAIPDLPPPGIERDRATLKLWLDERAAGADCRAKVHGLAEWMEQPK